MSSSVVPPSFDPFATHFFTNINNNALHPPTPPAPRAFPLPVPAPSQYYGVSMPGPASTSLPTAQTPAPIHAPQPSRAPAAPKPIFEPFRLERASPDLQDVLAKKNAPKFNTRK